MLRKDTKKILGVLFALLSCSVVAMYDIQAQSILEGSNIGFMQSTPPNFAGWVARTGTYTYENDNYNQSTTPPFKWDKTWNKPEEAKWSRGYGYGADADVYAFEVITDKNATDAVTGGGLKKIPSHLGFERSVRLGHTSDVWGGGVCSELQYRFTVNDQNALLIFAYAMVLVAPHPEQMFDNPTFEVVVTEDKVNDDDLVNDCLFFQNCGNFTSQEIEGNLPTGWHKGTTGGFGGYDDWVYSDWNQISVNLSEYLDKTVRVKIRVSGCIYTAHGGYGYFAARVEEPTVTLPGCVTDGEVVTTATAPLGYSSYEWFEYEGGENDSQDDIKSAYDSYGKNKIVNTERIFDIGDNLMENKDSKVFAVRLVAPTQHVNWGNSHAPACETYIACLVNDMRPKFDGMVKTAGSATYGNGTTTGYIPTDPDASKDEIGFYFDDVSPRSDDFPLDWQELDFGDGEKLLLEKTAGDIWKANETVTPLDVNHVRIEFNQLTGQPHIIYHEYEKGQYTLTRTAHSYERTPQNDEDSMFCEKFAKLEVDVPIRPSLQLTSPDTVCYGESVTMVATSPGDDATGYTYSWYYADDNGDPIGTDPFFVGDTYEIESLQSDIKVYVLVQTAENFYRSALDSVKVQKFPKIQIEGDTMICIGENLHLTATNLEEGTLGLRWTYQRPNANTQVGTTDQVATLEDAVTQDTTVFIIAETTNHCISWEQRHITVVKPVVTTSRQEICVGETTTLIGNGAADYSWSANPEDNSLPTPNQGMKTIDVTPETTTEYTMIGYGQNGCEASVNITIKVIPYPVVKFGFSPDFVDTDEPRVMFIDSSEHAAKSVWTFSDGGQMEGGTVTYEFNVLNVDSVGVHLNTSNYLGCSAEGDTTLPVVLFAVWMPNAFTPDGDGINDNFFFMTRNNLEDVTFEIYDRWGTKVYSYETKTYDYQNDRDISRLGWDGTYKDKYVQNGAYVWRLSYRRVGSSRIYDTKGTVNVIR